MLKSLVQSSITSSQNALGRRIRLPRVSQQYLHRRSLSSGWHPDYGYDILGDSNLRSQQGDRPKVILEGYGPNGFEVSQIVKKIDLKDPNSAGTVFVEGSIIAFPHGVFQWDVRTWRDLTVESLAPIGMHFPKVEVLMIGCDKIIPWSRMGPLMEGMRQEYGISVEKAELFYTIGTFNILNTEDRVVAVALIQDEAPPQP